MARFGSNIQPSLGRVDYSPMLQGALAQAQGIANAGNLKAQGIQSIGNTITQAVQLYNNKRQEERQANAMITQAKAAIGTLSASVTDSKIGGLLKSYESILNDPKATMQQKMVIAQQGIPQVAQVAQVGQMLNQRTEDLTDNEALKRGLEILEQTGDAAAAAKAYTGAGGTRTGQAVPMFTEIAKVREASRPRPENLTFQEQSVRARVEAFMAQNRRQPNPQELATIYAEVSKQGKPETNINMAPAETEFEKAAGKQAAEKQGADLANADAALENIQKIDEIANLIDSGDINTGVGAELFNNIDRLRAKFLDDKKAGKRVSDTELLDAMLGADVFPQIGALGIGARGLDTPAERDFIRKVIAGEISLNRETLMRLTQTRRALQERALGKINKRIEKGEFDRYFKATGREKSTFEIPAVGQSLPPANVIQVDY